ncbi:MAG TPA: tetratricopeptide repeat protein, partial [Alphaproteobacteria bacterium]|nr:tetratricopeptide repeat protein [Alphaproteobacteria bacterium]
MTDEATMAIDAAIAAQKAGNWSAALSAWQMVEMEAAGAERPGVWIGRGKALEHLDRAREARAVYAEGAEKWPDRREFAFGLARLSERQQDWEDALARWQEAARRWKETPEPHFGAARALLRLGRTTEAEAAAKQTAEQWPDDLRAKLLLAECLENQDDPGAALAYAQRLTEEHPESIPAAIRYSQILSQIDRPDEALAEMRRILAAIPPSQGGRPRSAAAVRTVNLLNQTGQAQEAFDTCEGALRADPDHFPLLLERAAALMALGRFEEAAAGYRDLVRRFPDAWEPYAGLAAIAPHLPEGTFEGIPEGAADNRLLQLAASKDPLRRPVIRYRSEEIAESPAGDSGVLVLLFGGATRKKLGMPVELLDKYFALHGISAIYLAKFFAEGFLDGLHVSTPESDELWQYLSDARRRLGWRRLYMVGVSGGGLIALRHGIALQADGVIGISAPTNLTAEFMQQGADERARLTIQRLNRSRPRELLDILPLLEACPRPPQIDLIYPSESPGDRRQAEYIQHLPTVRLHPVPGWKQHNVLEKIVASGEIFGFLDRILLTNS